MYKLAAFNVLALVVQSASAYPGGLPNTLSVVDEQDIAKCDTNPTCNEDCVKDGKLDTKATSIGAGAFQDCPSLTSANMPYVTKISNRAFLYSDKLTSVSMPKVTSVGTDAFHLCTSLTEANMPEVISVGINAFRSCASLTSIGMPKITAIGEFALTNCPSLTSVTAKNCDLQTYSACEDMPDAVCIESSAKVSSEECNK